MPRLAIDVDDVLLPLNQGFLQHHNQRYGTNLTLDNFDNYEVHKVISCTKDETVKRYNEYFRTDQHRNTNPIEGAQQAIHLLNGNHELYIVTSRPEIIELETRGWLEKHFPQVFRDVKFTNRCSFYDDKKTTKAEICSDLGIDLLVDDCLDYVEECQAAGIKTILFGNYGWNQTKNLNGIPRARDWRETLQFIDDLTSH
ncbi:hypothetical protein K8R33_05045 [archaeon]|nr:hypothetical protein [archaeon]